MPEEDIAVPGVGRRLLIFIVTLLLLYCTRIAVLLHAGCSSAARASQYYCNTGCSEYLISYAFGYVAINLGKMCSFLKRSAYL